ncbi:MAG TPA: DUF503 domain-containing protein [Herpetosiphonaceae bacterium]|nr:DUF503 domain-containing protein [Herpetosiphonaceae bacterium]
MIIGSLRLELYMPAAHSLKEKRSIIKSLIARLQNEFNASVAEVADQDVWQRGVVGVACVGGDSHYVEGQLNAIIRWVEQNRPDVTVLDVESELL